MQGVSDSTVGVTGRRTTASLLFSKEAASGGNEASVPVGQRMGRGRRRARGESGGRHTVRRGHSPASGRGCGRQGDGAEKCSWQNNPEAERKPRDEDTGLRHLVGSDRSWFLSFSVLPRPRPQKVPFLCFYNTPQAPLLIPTAPWFWLMRVQTSPSPVPSARVTDPAGPKQWQGGGGQGVHPQGAGSLLTLSWALPVRKPDPVPVLVHVTVLWRREELIKSHISNRKAPTVTSALRHLPGTGSIWPSQSL